MLYSLPILIKAYASLLTYSNECAALSYTLILANINKL